MRLDQLEWPTDAHLHGDGSVVITGMTYDSRTVRPGELFVCLPGVYADGHNFAAGAVDRGATALMVERVLPLPVPQLVVPATRRGLPIVAASYYGNPGDDLIVIGITGTDGKTTTSHIVDHILRADGHVTGVIGTVSVRIADEVVDHETRQTTPESVDIQRLLRQMVDDGVTHAVLEATSHGLDLHRLDRVPFRIAAVTNITTEHLEHHGTVEAYWAAKGSLFRRVSAAGGKSIVNLDDEGARSVLVHAVDGHTTTYSMGDTRADLRATDIDVGPTSTAFRLRVNEAEHSVTTPLTGVFNVANCLCAVGVALACGVPLENATASLTATPQIPGRMQLVDPWRRVKTIVDYAHTPASLEVMMRTLRAANPDGRLITVFGSAGERDVPKRAMQGAVAARLADFAVFTNEDPREENELVILDGLASGARGEGWVDGQHYWVIPDRRSAIRHAVSLAGPGDVLLLAGKGHERSIIVGQRKIPWDEVRVARDELARRFGDTM